MTTIATINPATGELVRRFEPHTAAEVERRLRLSAETFRAFKRTPPGARVAMLLRVAAVLEAGKEGFSRLITTEMGKPLGEASAEVEKSARVCRHYAAEAEHHLADEFVATAALASYVRYEPLGAILAVMPWNGPFSQVIRVAAPALAAGNVVLLKHASNVPQCALALEEVFRRAHFPAGAFQTLLVGAGSVAGLVADARVAAVTFTGSDEAGRRVAAAAGLHVKKTVLELGGSDPFIVMPSADIKEAARAAVRSRTANGGQSCVAAKRFVVHEDVYEEFVRRLVEGMRALRVGDPADTETEVGPLATLDALEELDEQVRESVAAGARVLTGGGRLERPGYFYEPTVLADVPAGSPAAREELFGPVAALFRVRDVEEAIAVANGTPYGLGASAWTRDEPESARFIGELEAGLVFVNAVVASDPRLPFGGVKRSGYGRELGAHGLREFVSAKTVWVGGGAPRRGVESEAFSRVEDGRVLAGV